MEKITEGLILRDDKFAFGDAVEGVFGDVADVCAEDGGCAVAGFSPDAVSLELYLHDGVCVCAFLYVNQELRVTGNAFCAAQ